MYAEMRGKPLEEVSPKHILREVPTVFLFSRPAEPRDTRTSTSPLSWATLFSRLIGGPAPPARSTWRLSSLSDDGVDFTLSGSFRSCRSGLFFFSEPRSFFLWGVALLATISFLCICTISPEYLRLSSGKAPTSPSPKRTFATSAEWPLRAPQLDVPQ